MGLKHFMVIFFLKKKISFSCRHLSYLYRFSSLTWPQVVGAHLSLYCGLKPIKEAEGKCSICRSQFLLLEGNWDSDLQMLV